MDSINEARPAPAMAADHGAPGAVVRDQRQAQGLTLAQLGERVGYSAAQVSRYERGIAPMTNVAVLRRFANVLAIPLHTFGLPEQPSSPERRHRLTGGAFAADSRLPMSKVAH